MKKNEIPVINQSELMDIVSKCYLKRSDFLIDYCKLLEALQNYRPYRSQGTSPNNLPIIIDSASIRIAEDNIRFVKTQQEMADILGITVKTLRGWLCENVLVLKRDKNGYNVRDALKQLREYNFNRIMKRINHKHQ